MSDPRCAKCGHPQSNHPYRHMFVGPFVGPSEQDTITALQAERDAWKARAEAAEAALIHEVKRSRRHLARSTLDIVDALTLPADLARGAADD